MLRPRIIPCLLVSRGGLVKTVRLKDAKYVGDPELDYVVLTALATSGFKVRSFSEEELDLEDIFMKVTRGAVA